MNLLKKAYQISGIAAVAAMLVSVPIVIWVVVTQTSVSVPENMANSAKPKRGM